MKEKIEKNKERRLLKMKPEERKKLNRRNYINSTCHNYHCSSNTCRSKYCDANRK